MGMVQLDVQFQVERAFGIEMPREWPQKRLGIVRAGDDATLGRFHEMVPALCAEQGATVPEGSWERIVEIVERAAGFENPTRESTLREIARHG